MTLLKKNNSVLNATVIIGALGYFVDIYDKIIFSVVKKSSILSLKHWTPSNLDVKSNLIEYLKDSVTILDHQMIGMLLGGIFWGILGDRLGRIKVLFGSIIVYSVGCFLTSYTTSISEYAWLRFFTGIGLAGELGGAITLVNENLPKHKRGIGTAIIAGIGVLGGAFAFYMNYLVNLDWSHLKSIIPNHYFQWIVNKEGWRMCYQIGAIMGIVQVFLRYTILESKIYKNVALNKSVERGNFFRFFVHWHLFKKYVLTILVGLPIWYAGGILISQSDVLGLEFTNHKISNIDTGIFFFCSSSGALFGDIIGCFVCQYFQSRKKALILYYAIFIVVFLLYFSPFNNSSTSMYLFCFLVGFSTGILTIILSIGAEQFGTNLRSTAATSIPNMIRASFYVGNYFMITFFPNYFLFNVVESAFATGIIFIFIPFIALFFLEETYHKNLDYVETFKS